LCHKGNITVQSDNRFFDELARLMTGAAGAAQGFRRELETLMRQQGEKVATELDLVTREEFEAVRGMAQAAREENESLKVRMAALEAKLAASGKAPSS
jgi:BMFP domain-containing protein YqiC